jgi:protein TonB
MRRDFVIYGGTLLLSLVAHVVLFEGLGAAARNAPREKQRVLEFAMIEPPPPPPPAEPEPPPPPPKPKPVDLTKVPPPPVEAPPPPSVEEPPSAEPPKPVFGISMSSTVGPGSSGFSVRVGNTLMKDPDKEFTKPEDVRGYRPVPLHQVNKMPSKVGDCQPEDPADRRRFDGQVMLEVDIKDDGTVGDVRVVRSLNPQADEIAARALKRCRFSAAEVGGKAVATTIQYKFTFVLEE